MTDGDRAEIRCHGDRGEDFGTGRRRQKVRLLGKIEAGEGSDVGADGAIIAGQRQIRPAAWRRHRENSLLGRQRMNMAERQHQLQRDGEKRQPRAES